MAAVARAVPAVIEDPDAAAREIVKLTGKKNYGLTKAGIEAMAPLYSKTGEMDPEQGSALVDWMYEQGMIESRLPVSELLTSDYLEPRP
jgi:ABC-type nitrate/sulfonate/bicarbonate transport system substrate-binding protein